MAYINELSEKMSINKTDYMIIEDNESTQKIRLQTLLKDLPTGIQINSNNSIFLTREDGTIIGEGINIIDTGTDAREIELTFDGVFVKWRYVGDENWVNLFSTAQLNGTGSSTTTPVPSDIYLTIGNVSTLTPGESATASIEKLEDNNFILNLGIPRGETVTVDNTSTIVSPQVTKVINKTTSNINTTIQTNTEYFFGTLDSLVLNVADGDCSNTDFNAKVHFRTRDITSIKFNQSTNLHLIGDDCIFGALIPKISSDYKIEISYGGQRLIGKVYCIPYGGIATLDNFSEGNVLVNIAKTYIDNMNKFTYGKTTILSNVSSSSEIKDSAGKFYIDCSTFVSLAFRGIKFNDSKYYDWSKSNSPRTSLYSFAVEFPRNASQQAKYCIEQGWVLPKENWGTNFNKLKAGDIIFYSESPLSTASTWGTRFMRVSHVAICIGSVSGNMMLYDAVSSTGGLRQQNVNSSTASKICMVARPQQNVSSSNIGDFEIIDETVGEDSENFLEVGNISLSTGDNIVGNMYARTQGFINVENFKSLKLKINDNNHLISSICFYDDNKNLVSSVAPLVNNYNGSLNENCKYIRFVMEKKDRTDIEPTQINYIVSYGLSDLVTSTPPKKVTYEDYPKITGKITNNFQLVAKLKEVLENYETIYVYGAIGQKLSKSLIENRRQAYSWFYTSARMEKYKKAIATGRTIWSFDCVNLIKSVLWGWRADTSASFGGAVYGSNGVSDVSADGCISICRNVKSTGWENMKIGEAVWMKGHIGVYVGEGKVIECSASGFNVELTACGNIGSITGLRTRNWTKHGELPWITYLDECPFGVQDYGIEFTGNSQLSNIVTFSPSEDNSLTVSESEATICDFGLGEGLWKDNYTNCNRWDDLINEIAPQFGIDPAIVKMVMAGESGGVPNLAEGTEYGYGLMCFERNLLVQGYRNPYTGAINSGRYTFEYFDGTTEEVILTMSNLNGNTDSGRRLQIKVGCDILRKSARKYYWNIVHTLITYNMGQGALNFICAKYVCEKYGWTLVNSGALSKQSDKVQEKVKEVLATGDLGYLAYRKWYTETGCKLLKSGPGTANNIELYLQYYKVVNGQLPYFYDDEGVKITAKGKVNHVKNVTEDDMGNALIGYPTELVCFAPTGVTLGTKILIQGTNTEFDGKIFTVVGNHSEYDTYTIKICVENKEYANQFNSAKGVLFVGDVLNNRKVVVATSNCNVRTGNSTKYEKIGYITKGFKATFLSEMSNGWKKIDYRGKEAYVTGLYTTIKEV